MLRRKRIHAIAVFALLAGAFSCLGTVKRSYSFDSLPDAGEMIIGKSQDQYVGVKDGVLKFHPNNRKSFFGGVTFPLRQYVEKLEMTQNALKISFRLRVAGQVLETRGGPHLGLKLSTKQDKILHMIYPGRKAASMSLRHGKTRMSEKVIGGFQDGKNEWNDISLLLTGNEFTMFVNKRRSFHCTFETEALDNLFLYAYNIPMEIDDMKIEVLALSETAFVSEPLLHASFRNSFDGTDHKGTKKIPVLQGRVETDAGISGNGISLKDKRSSVTYASDTALFSNRGGGVMFWVKPGMAEKHLILSAGNKNKNFFKIFQMHNSIAVEIQNKGLPEQTLLQRWGRQGIIGNWYHVAVTWHGKKIRLYVNGLSYTPTTVGLQSDGKELHFPDLESIKQITLHGKSAFSDLKVYRRPLKTEEIYAAYRQFMPIDLVIQRSLYTSGRKFHLQLQAAPGGELMFPAPLKKDSAKASVELGFQIKDKHGKLLCSFDRKKYDIPRIRTIELPELTLEPGSYALETEVFYQQGCFIRTFDFAVAPQSPAPVPESDDNYILGKRIYHRKFIQEDEKTLLQKGKAHFVTRNGLAYLEAGQELNDTFGLIIPFAEENRGKPVLLRFHWPDDRARCMGLQMFKKTKYKEHRDRLQGGIQAGGEYPETQKMVQTDYIFWPGTESYLLQVLTKVKGMPAALSEVEIFEIKGKLPALKIRKPEGMPGRKFGFFDEDQSFITNLNKDVPRPKEYSAQTPYYLHHLLEYFRYTGQNAFAMPVLRYIWIGYNSESMSPRGDLFPRNFDELPYIFDEFEKSGVDVTGLIDIWNLPEFHFAARSDIKIPDECFMKYKDGSDVKVFQEKRMNFMHPLVRSIFLKHIRNFARIHKNQKALTGFNLTLDHLNHGEHPYRASLAGYDDYTTGLFEKETGIKVPRMKRYDFLMGEKKREWLQWRADKVTEFIKAVREELDRINPRWNLYVTYRSLTPTTETGDLRSSWDYLADGLMDLNAIKKLHNTYPAPQFRANGQRWYLFHYAKRTRLDEIFYNAAIHENAKVDGAVRQIHFFNFYYETLSSTLDKNHNAFFTSLDIKPWGRYSLMDCIWSIGKLDALYITSGGQPLGTLGREKEMREFAKAYRALPAMPFRDVTEQNDPVAVRQLQTKNGTYFYLANLLHDGCQVTLKTDKDTSFLDLSSGKTLKNRTIELKGYELRSFLIPPGKGKIVAFDVEIPAKITAFYQEKLDKIRQRLAALEKTGYDSRKIKSKYDACQELFQGRKYADLHRMICSADFETFFAETENPDLILKKNAMIRKGHFAVNCGSREYLTTSDGKLFFPDQRYEKGSLYGYTGQLASNADRSTANMKNKKSALFEKELYNFSAYTFEVPNGKYTLRLHMRWGFEKAFRPGHKVSGQANGNPLFKDLDYYNAMKGNFTNCLLLEYPGIPVTNNILSFEFTDASEPSVRLLNAIEVIRGK